MTDKTEGRYKQMARIYTCDNGVVDVVVYWAGKNAKARGKRIKGNSTPKKQEANFKSAVRTMARKLHCNFGHGDALITLNYLDFPEGTREDWIHQRDLFLQRLRRAMKKLGLELKYIAITSDMDGETGEDVRPHHHIIIPRVDFDLVRSLWPFGTVDYQLLRDQRDYTPLCVYLLRQVRTLPDGKKYHCSRNLKGPDVAEVEYTGKELNTPKGAKVVERHFNDQSPVQYARYILAPKKPRKSKAGKSERARGKTGGGKVG